ncbi:MAG: hypothetical protein CL778_02050 [Chloroflexi bacterium]|nr:hypothetical protein [Chloroflexota bacterium]|tara:strand:+ start:20761 stop:22041 length:1281 start_codon:yes stop_codon:yes gene_type:complete
MQEKIGPLNGIKILEFGSFIAGPFAGQILADMGADVVKIEPPSGDPWRNSSRIMENEGRGFITLNRGTRSLSIDLKNSNSREILSKLIKKSDAVVSNNRPDTSKKLSIDYESISKQNPTIIYVEITGYGPKGPRSKDPGFDLVMQGYTGAVATEGKLFNGQPEVITSSSYIDFATAYAAASGVMAGIIRRYKTGKGGKISTSLLSNALAMQSLHLVEVEEYPTPQFKWTHEEKPVLESSGASFEEIMRSYKEKTRHPLYHCYYRAYMTKDGGINLGTLADHAKERLVDYMGISDPRIRDKDYNFESDEAKKTSKILIEKFETFFKSKTTKDIIKNLRERDIPCEPIKFIKELLDDQQALDNDYIIDLKHSNGFRYKSAGPILQFTDDDNSSFISSPSLGEHTDDILFELGFTKGNIDKFRNLGIIK